jgi:hypothetical protein
MNTPMRGGARSLVRIILVYADFELARLSLFGPAFRSDVADQLRLDGPEAEIAEVFATTSCAPTVSNLDPVTARPDWPTLPFSASVTVEPFEVPERGEAQGEKISAQYRDSALTRMLREHRVFARTETAANRGFQSDLVLRGEVRARWDPLGAKNFFTWWPGGLFLVPNWHGTRMQFFANARTELMDARTGEVVGTYEASTAHEVVHRSPTPGPFFGAAIIVPNVIRGARFTYPRDMYKEVMYPIAYSALWQKIAGQIVEDLAGKYASEAEARRERCGDQLGQPPRVGLLWTEFVSCQSDYYEHFAEAVMKEGSASVFIHAASGSRIYVVDGEIVSWEMPRMMPAVGAPPP